jgi:hypothetical protein
MAIGYLILIPESGKKVIMNNLCDKINALERKSKDELMKILKKEVLALDVNTVKDFYNLNDYLNEFLYVVGEPKTTIIKSSAITSYYNLLFTAFVNVYGKISDDFNDFDIDTDSYKQLMSFLSSITIDKKDLMVDNIRLSKDYGIILSKGLLEDRSNYINLINNLVKEHMRLPCGISDILTMVVDNVLYNRIINTLIKVTKDYFNLQDNVVNYTYNKAIIHTPIKFLINDLIKKQIASLPEIGNVVIDTELDNYNKSFLLGKI